MFQINYFQDENGKKPVEEFIDSLDIKMKAKVFGRLELLEQYGSLLCMPYARHLNDGIYELRVSSGNNAVRVLYFFIKDKQIILTHGFVKKTQKTPAREIAKAQSIRARWKAMNE